MNSVSFISFVLLLNIHLALAHEITLGKKGKLTGELQTSPSADIVSLRSPLSNDPLQIKTEAISKIVLAPSNSKNEQSSLIIFKNGDQIPAEIVSYKNEKLQIQSPWKTPHEIAKKELECLFFKQPESTIYEGPKESEWTLKNCIYENEGFRFTGTGTAKWEAPPLPKCQKFIFELEWTDYATFEILLANPDASNSKTNCYRLSLDNTGLQIIRHSPSSAPITLNTSTEYRLVQVREKKIMIELQIDRNKRKLELTVNGKKVLENIIDPPSTGPTPNGKYYSINCTTRSNCYIRKFKILEFDPDLLTVYQEKKPNEKTDTVYDLESNRYSGEIKEIETQKDKKLKFINPHAADEINAPIAQLAKVFFAGNPTKAEGRFLITTSTLGKLHVDAFLLKDDALLTEHQALGSLVIPLSMIQEISRP